MAGFGDVLRSEWTKLWSLRAPMWTLVAAALLSIGLGPGVVGWVVDATPRQERAAQIDPVAVTYGGFHIAILAFGAIGALAVTSEYTQGTIRLTFAAVPRRLHVLAAKVLVAAAAVLPAGVAVSAATFLLGQRALTEYGLQVAFTSPGVPRAVVGAGLFAMVCAVLGVALGTLTRHATAAIVLLVLVLFVPQLLIDVLPESWDGAARFIPHWAGFAVFTLRPETTDTGMLAPWTGFGVFCGYVALVLAAGALAWRRRDA